MDIVRALASVGHSGIADLTAFFRHGAARSEPGSELVSELDERLGADSLQVLSEGLFSDLHEHLEGLSPKNRLHAVIAIVESTLAEDGERLWMSADAAKMLANICEKRRGVIFSFDGALHPCLLAAEQRRARPGPRRSTWPIRFAGSPPVARLVGAIAAFLDLPIWVYAGPPWQKEALREYEPEEHSPDFAIAVPIGDTSFDDDERFVQSARRTRLTRAAVNGRLEPESLTVFTHPGAEPEGLIFVSRNFCSSTGQAKRMARREAVDSGALRAAIALGSPIFSRSKEDVCILRMSPTGKSRSTIAMSVATSLDRAGLTRKKLLPVSGSTQKVPVERIKATRFDLHPLRYLSVDAHRDRGAGIGPLGGALSPRKIRIADLFEVTRPAVVRQDRNGTVPILQIGAKDIGPYGQKLGSARTLTLEETRVTRIEGQKLRAGDVVIAIRTRVGRMAIFGVGDEDMSDLYGGQDIYAGQDFAVLRRLKRGAADGPGLTCDPRLMFMHMSARDTQRELQMRASENRNVIPIVEIERLALPEELVEGHDVPRNENVPEEKAREIRAGILEAFGERMQHIRKLGEIEAEMAGRLNEVLRLGGHR